MILLFFIVLNIVGFFLFLYMLFVFKYFDNLDISDSREIKLNLIMIEDNLVLKDGKFILDDFSKEILYKNKVWVMLIDNNGDRIWGFDLLKEILSYYILIDVVKFLRFFLKDYFVYVWEYLNGILVIGYLKDKYIKFNFIYMVKEIE